MARDRGIFVEILIQGDIEEVWQRTQIPELHEQWDLRFTSIKYLPKAAPEEPQQFSYSTRLGFGARIDGAGESAGTQESAALRTSALKFWSDDAKSLIAEGSGYWKYEQTAAGVRFLTWYDYRTRFGALGRTVDGLVFRPLIGWATAWSFDRLRLWIERGVPPAISARMAAIHAAARLGIAFTWLWQGMFPKLLFPSADEKFLLGASGLPEEWLAAAGWIEVLFAVAAIVLWRWRPFFLVNALLMVAALIAVAASSPGYLVAAFNPVSLNVGIALLSVIGYLASADLPTATHCLRQPAGGYQ